MNFPGKCTLSLTSEALLRAIEGAINGSRLEGEDYVHCLEISQRYSYGDYQVTITTDSPTAPLQEPFAAEAA